MQKSIETRWLLNFNEFKTIEHWFKQKETSFKNKDLFPRQDYYLKLVKSTNLGIKIREPKLVNNEQKSKLEVKLLIQDNGIYKFNNNNHGNVNTWLKYSFETIGNEIETARILNLFTNQNTQEPWIKIDKDRILVKFDTKEKQLVSGDTIIDEGSGIELTKFKINNTIYYSLGIETFSSSNIETNNFDETVDFFFKEVKISNLNTLKSLSYPEIISNHFLGY
ncbi:hypothetical protein SY27_11840 [Flavobacterium sp. 316]|uniref:hypothetical protein n=1 Tax=Flavobacterium sp. 316 TaxID=1603293 RepID=UPI0005E080CD|nr:hypothetical protein [Flavobacterium sp. 316]KIX20593.1 hypothetical protein SY27_11840 [Flavobacterium sp. 316]